MNRTMKLVSPSERSKNIMDPSIQGSARSVQSNRSSKSKSSSLKLEYTIGGSEGGNASGCGGYPLVFSPCHENKASDNFDDDSTIATFRSTTTPAPRPRFRPGHRGLSKGTMTVASGTSASVPSLDETDCQSSAHTRATSYYDCQSVQGENSFCFPDDPLSATESIVADAISGGQSSRSLYTCSSSLPSSRHLSKHRISINSATERVNPRFIFDMSLGESGILFEEDSESEPKGGREITITGTNILVPSSDHNKKKDSDLERILLERNVFGSSSSKNESSECSVGGNSRDSSYYTAKTTPKEIELNGPLERHSKSSRTTTKSTKSKMLSSSSSSVSTSSSSHREREIQYEIPFDSHHRSSSTHSKTTAPRPYEPPSRERDHDDYAEQHQSSSPSSSNRRGGDQDLHFDCRKERDLHALDRRRERMLPPPHRSSSKQDLAGDNNVRRERLFSQGSDGNFQPYSRGNSSSSCNNSNGESSTGRRERDYSPAHGPSQGPYRQGSDGSFQHPTSTQALTIQHERTVEITPGLRVRLRSEQETIEAVRHSFVVPCTCIGCSMQLYCIQDTDYILCPECLIICPMEVARVTKFSRRSSANGSIASSASRRSSIGSSVSGTPRRGSMNGSSSYPTKQLYDNRGGVGMGFSEYDLVRMQQEILFSN